MIKIKKIKVETTPVYDVTVDGTHCFFANDILVHNCQEIGLATSPYSSVAELYQPCEEEILEFQDEHGNIHVLKLWEYVETQRGKILVRDLEEGDEIL